MIVDDKFSVDAKVNRRSSRMIVYNYSNIPSMIETRNPTFVVVSGVLASDGSVMNPQFIEFGLRIGTKEYMNIFKN